MPDYLYLLETRVSPEQRAVIERVQAAAAQEGINIYLTGGAVRDLIGGAPIRDLDFTAEGNPARLVRELEKAGAEILEADEELRHYELIWPGGGELSISAAREERFAHPGAKPEMRFSTIMDDLRRRDFSINAIGLSLNPASRGLVLDPTNGLADIEKREVRVLSMHSFTNQPIRLMRILRYTARMGFAMEARTGEWFALAMEREVQKRFEAEDVGRELRALGREENPVSVLKEWARHGMLGAIHPRLGKRTPSFERMIRLLKVREAMAGQGYRVPLAAPVISYALGKLSARELTGTLSRLKFRAAEIDRITHLDREAAEIIKMLKGRKTKSPQEAFRYLDRIPLEMLAYVQNETSQSVVLGKIKNFLYKWKPLRQQLPVMELESLGVPRGPVFDRILEEFFQLQLAGRARQPQDRLPVLRKLAGIKPEKEKKPKEKDKELTKGAKHEKSKTAAKSSGDTKPEPAGISAAGSKGKMPPARKSPVAEDKEAPDKKEKLLTKSSVQKAGAKKGHAQKSAKKKSPAAGKGRGGKKRR